MVARGEIGFLIASTANSGGIFENETLDGDGEGVSQIFLVVIWAIVLCTVISPVVTGLLVKRVRRLQSDERERSEGQDPLGVWGVVGG